MTMRRTRRSLLDTLVLHRDITDAITPPEVRDVGEPGPRGWHQMPEALADLVTTDLARWSKVVTTA